MAGGRGKRLRPFTYVEPKPLLPVGNINSIEYLIGHLKISGFDEIFISINYLKEKFSVCHEYSKKYDVHIKLIEETHDLGTVGSLSLMNNYLDEPFSLINGDLFTQPPYKQMLMKFKNENADMMIGMTAHETISPYGIVKFDENNRLLKIDEKPKRKEWINSGVYFLNPKTLKFLNNQYMDIHNFIEIIIQNNGSIITFDIGEKWLDIGCIDDYEKASKQIEDWDY